MDQGQKFVLDTINKIFGTMHESLPPDPGQVAAETYAHWDVRDTIEKAQLSTNTLLDCCFDPDALFAHLRKFPAVGIDNASESRRGHYFNALRHFCQLLVLAACENPDMHWAVHRRLLSQQQEILRQLMRTT